MLNFIRKNSLDIVGGVIAQAIFASKFLGLTLRVDWLVMLSLSVWIIYTADHLLDRRSYQGKPKNPRHPSTGFLPRLVLMLLAAAINTGLVFLRFSSREILTGGMMLFLVAGYVIVEKRVKTKNYFLFPKEWIIAILYTVCIWIYPVLWAPKPVHSSVLVIILMMIMLALNNTLILSFYEISNDKSESRFSFTRFFGTRVTRRLVSVFSIIIAGGGTVLAMISQGDHTLFAGWLIVTMALGQLALIRFTRFFSKKYRYGMVNELLFWLPAAIVVIQ